MFKKNETKKRHLVGQTLSEHSVGYQSGPTVYETSFHVRQAGIYLITLQQPSTKFAGPQFYRGCHFRHRRLLRRLHCYLGLCSLVRACLCIPDFVYKGCAKEFVCVGVFLLQFDVLQLLLAELGLVVQMASATELNS